MPSLAEKFGELERLIIDHRRSLALHAGVPFVLLIYDPAHEWQCRDEQAHLATKLEDAGLTVREVLLDTFVFDHYTKLGLLQKVFEKEVDDQRTVYRDLARNTRPALAQHIVGVAEEINRQHLDGVIFLSRVAHLYPFVRVANLLEDLENRVKHPLVVLYPGELLDGELRFLGLPNSDGPHSKYRARRI